MFYSRMTYVCLCVLFTLSLAFPNATITGKINDSDSNEPLIGVNVILLETTTKIDLEKLGKSITVQTHTDYGASTDIEGEFIIKNLPVGEYTLKAMYIGYENKEIPILINESISYTFDIQLTVSEIKLEQATVTGTYEREEKKTEAPAKIETVTSKEIEQATTANLGGYLQGLKGVDFTASGVNNYSLSIRGFNSSFSTRLLMLTDGRPANVPSLRVVNFSTVPVSSDDVERIEVVLGPATALYGANAHSGVINIISKAPALSEGFSASFAGSFDERNMKKISFRQAAKLNNKLSFKVSAESFQAVEWPYISESEYRSHKNPWVGFSGRIIDGKDNNASITSFIGGLTPVRDSNLRWVQTQDKGIYISPTDRYYVTLNGWDNRHEGLHYLMLGDGEPNHGDLDGDGLAGEDWFNGHDDDGDGRIDEDYWYADGIDNQEPWYDDCTLGEFVGEYSCSNEFDYNDENGNGIHDGPEPFFDLNWNGVWDEGEWWQDLQGDGYTTGEYDTGEYAYDSWEDWDSDLSWDTYNGEVDELIDKDEDEWVDGVDNNQNGIIDENQERYTSNQLPSQWANDIDNQNVLVRYGRVNKYYLDGSLNPWYLEDNICCDGIDNDKDGFIDGLDPDEKIDMDLRGESRYNDKTFTMEFDVYEWDFGDDGIPGDYYYDIHGDSHFHRGEPGTGTGDFLDYGLDGYKYYPDLDNGDGHQALFVTTNSEDFNDDGEIDISPGSEEVWLVYIPAFDVNGEPIIIYGPDEGEGDGIFQPGDTWNDDGDWIVEDFEEGWTLTSNFDLIQPHILDEDDDGNGIIDDCIPGVYISGFGWSTFNQIAIDADGDEYIDNCLGICQEGDPAECVEDLNLYYITEIGDENLWYYSQTTAFDPFDYKLEVSPNLFVDVWPPPDLSYGDNDIIQDCGQDGYCWDFEELNQSCPQQARDLWGNYLFKDNGDPIIINGPDYGENNGVNPLDYGDYDNVYDTSDGEWDAVAEPFEDINHNGVWDYGEPFTDSDGNGYYNNGDWNAQLDQVNDTNGDGIDDYPDFEVINNKIEFRADYDPSSDLNMTFQTGHAYTKTQQVTGVGRYIADGWETTYYQVRGRYKNLYAQFFYNQNDAGMTRGYNRGDIITDESSNHGYQLQYSFDLPRFSTEFIVGFDYMRTDPFTNGSVLNDGPNGFDDDEDSFTYARDDIDQDGDGEIINDYDEIAWGIDEADEFEENILSEEFGVYFQAKTDLLNNQNPGVLELITSARVDYHDQLKEEGLLFGPKIGLTLKPSDFTEFRMSYGKAYNTPTITALHTNLIFGRWGEYFTMILKGNRDGTPYARADNLGKYGEYGYAIDLVDPFYYKPEPDGTYTKIPFDSGHLDGCVSDSNNPCDSYTDRIQGAPLFYNTGDSGYPIDYIPLDTLNHIIYIPSAYGDGVHYTPSQSVSLPDVDPLRSESMQTVEFGFKSFLTERMLVSMDIYFTEYNNFFSPATFITPLVRDRYTDEIIGLIPANLDGTNPPYATAWDGIDNDDDFSGMGYYVTQDQVSCVDEFGLPDPSVGYPCGFNQETGEYYLDYEDLANQIDDASLQDWAVIFGWDDDKDGDGNIQDPGEWGYVDRLYETDDGYYIYTVVTPDQIWGDHIGEITQPISDGNFIAYDNVDTRWLDVGVDEYSTRIGGHYEGEILDAETGQIGFPSKLPIITLSSLNYGNVHHAGMDIGLTYFFSEKFIMDFNFTHFNSTAYYNELTKKYDPINSPKFKFNIAANINTNKLGSVLLKWRHVDKFKWADGTWAGTIGPYNIIDIHYNYEISKNLKFGVTATNLFNDMHRELVGGAEMGRQVIMRLTTTFN